MKNKNLSYNDIFKTYSNSVIPIGWVFSNDLSEIPARKKEVLTGKRNGKIVHVVPCATAFLISIDKKNARFVTASHAFPDIADNADIAVLILGGEISPHEEKLTLADLHAYSGVLKFECLKEQDVCIFDIETPNELYAKKPKPIPFGKDYLIGDPVCTIGYPFLGYDDVTEEMRLVERLTCANLSAICIQRNTLTIEFDNYVGPGNSGGPLINLRTGCAIGIVNWIRAEGEGMTTFSNATSVLELARLNYFKKLQDFCSLCVPCQNKIFKGRH